jgi:hypothetical protein
MDYCMVWQPIYDLRWEIMNVCTIHEIIFDDLQWEIMNVCTVHEIIFENSAELSAKPADNSVNSAEFWVLEFFVFLTWFNLF